MSDKTEHKKRLRPLFFYPKILTFHKVWPGLSYGSTNYSPKRLDRLLGFLSSSGYRFYSVAELLKSRPEKGIALTFDDGYQHLLDYLPPLIDKYNLRPTIFIPAGLIGRSNRWDYSHLFQNAPHLNREGITELAQQGAVIGAHGNSHCDLTGLDDRRLSDELVRSKGFLEDITAREVKTMGYPFGRANDRVVEAARKAGYTHGFTMAFPDETDNPLTTGRYAVYTFDSQRSIVRRLQRGPLFGLERAKARMSNTLSLGTVLLNRLRRTE